MGINTKILQALNDFAKRTNPDEHRDHLGASIIGQECARQIWSTFRWLSKPRYEKFDKKTGKWVDNEASQKRLFERGHLEEARFVRMLRGVGMVVREFDPNAPLKDGKPQQYRISDVGGHFGGSLDAEIDLPPELAPKRNWITILGEFKSHSAKSFAKLINFGLGLPDEYKSIVKGEHVAQMDTYAYKRRLPLQLYMGVNKDTDDLYPELREANHRNGAAMVDKARLIIRSQKPPPRIKGASYNGFPCGWCDHRDNCLMGEKPNQVNCRSCKFAEPIPGPAWRCNKFAKEIPRPIILTGCPQYQPITDE